MGVCGGIAEAIAVPSITIRLTFLLLILASGVGAALYLLLALFMLPPGYDAGTLRSRVRANSRRLGDALRSVYQLAVDNLVALTAQRELQATPIRAWLGGGLLFSGVVILCWSLGLLWWLTFWRTVALSLVFVGLGLLRGQTGRLQESDDEASPSI